MCVHQHEPISVEIQGENSRLRDSAGKCVGNCSGVIRDITSSTQRASCKPFLSPAPCLSSTLSSSSSSSSSLANSLRACCRSLKHYKSASGLTRCIQPLLQMQMRNASPVGGSKRYDDVNRVTAPTVVSPLRHAGAGSAPGRSGRQRPSQKEKKRKAESTARGKTRTDLFFFFAFVC